MSRAQRPAGWSALQAASVLLLSRVFLFFCCGQGYTAAYAKGTAVAVMLTAGLLLPLLPHARTLTVPERLLPLYRVYALLCAARMLAGLGTLLHSLQAPHPLLTVLLVLGILASLTALPHAAAARASAVSLIVLGAAFLLLPVSGIAAARTVWLHTPDDAGAAFLRELSRGAELGILPLLWMRQQQKPRAAVQSALFWLGGRGIVLPLVILFGAMQNGRLLRWEGNPFFLLLARTPLSDALRTDGLWMLLAVSCGILAMTVHLQIAAEPVPLMSTAHLKRQRAVLIPLAGLAMLWYAVPAPDLLFAVCAVLLGIAVPWGTVCAAALRRRTVRKEPA